VCQALTGDKLHKTNIKDNTGLTCKPARVKGIGPRMSKVSDVTTLQIRFRTQVDEHGRRTPKGLSPLLSVAWHFLSTIENAGE
jgi:hypothetical protein